MACFLHKKNSNANSVHISIMKGDPIMLNIHAHKESTIYKSGISNCGTFRGTLYHKCSCQQHILTFTSVIVHIPCREKNMNIVLTASYELYYYINNNRVCNY